MNSGITGILLAAGRGRRMGRTKQLLPWPPEPKGSTPLAKTPQAKTPQASTVVEASFDAISRHCDEMVVVLGHEAEAVAKALGHRSYERASVDPDAEMLEAIKAGLRQAMASGRTPSAAMVHPADQPAIDQETIQRLLREHINQPELAIMPDFKGCGGHPVIIPVTLFDTIFTFCSQGGLRQLWIEHPQRRLRVPVNDPGAIIDLDYPKDYADCIAKC